MMIAAAEAAFDLAKEVVGISLLKSKLVTVLVSMLWWSSLVRRSGSGSARRFAASMSMLWRSTRLAALSRLVVMSRLVMVDVEASFDEV